MEKQAPMQAPATVPQLSSSRKLPPVITVSGYGARLHVERGHLFISDRGLAGAGEWRLTRVAHGVRRIVFVTPDATLTVPALEWCAAQDISVVVLERDGRVLLATGTQGTCEAKLRRAQACLPEPLKLRLSKMLIDRKLEAQAKVLRERVLNPEAAAAIDTLRLKVWRAADTPNRLRTIESSAAAMYWNALAPVLVEFRKQDMRRVPLHWFAWGSRHSPLTSPSPRLAVTPAQAMANYCYALLEAEARIACAALGLDPLLGVFHVDRGQRDSLVFDVMEPCRPQIEAFLLELMREPLERSMFFERPDGNCRLMAVMCARLAESSPLWARTVAPVAEWITEEIWKTIPAGQVRKPSTRLTQSARREAKRSA